MNKAFKRIFWGYILVLIEIHLFVFDILADPIGYYLIFSGINLIFSDFTIGKKARNLSLALIFFSIPTVFIQQNAGTTELGQLPFLSVWSSYWFVFELVKLILVFYIFQLIIDIVHKQCNKEKIRHAERTFSIYIIVMLIITFSNSFMMNVTGDVLIWITIITIIISIIMEVLFLVLLRSLRKLPL